MSGHALGDREQSLMVFAMQPRCLNPHVTLAQAISRAQQESPLPAPSNAHVPLWGTQRSAGGWC